MVYEYYKDIDKLLFIGIVMMLMLSITNAGKNILYTVYGQSDYTLLAPLQYVCNYLFGPLTLLIVDSLIARNNFKQIFYVSSFNLNLFLIGGLLVTYCEDSCNRVVVNVVTIMTSLLAGVLQTIFYVAFVSYINYLSNDSNKQLFYGISFTFTSMSNILSNVIGYYLIDQFTDFQFYVIILLASLVVQLLYLFVKDDRELAQTEPYQFTADISFQFTAIVNQLKEHNYSLFLPTLCFAGLMNSVIYLFIPELVSRNGYSDDSLTSHVFLAFLITGTGQAIGGVSSGKLSEYFTERKVLNASLIISLLAVVAAQVGNALNINSAAFVSCFLFGLSDSAISALSLVIITKEISTSNHAFAGYNLCQSVGFGMSSIWWGVFNRSNLLYDLGFLYVANIITTISVQYYQHHKIKYVLQENTKE